jgi:hypothetical protein
MRIESNRAWLDAVRWIAANREALLALAGVFFAFPVFLLLVAYPQPEPPPGATEEQMLRLVADYSDAILPAVLGAITVMLVGALAMLAFFSDRSRPTMGEALKQGLIATPTSLAAFLISQIAIGGSQLILLNAVGLLGMPALVALAWLIASVAGLYVTVRFSLSAAIAIGEALRNPFTVLRRSWDITRKRGSAMFLFYMLFFIAALVLLIVLALIVGTLLVVLLPHEPARVISALVSSGVIGLVILHFVALTGALYRQLVGPSPAAAARPVE